MGLTGDFDRAVRLQAALASMAQDSLGATRAAMDATRQSADACFAEQRDPAGAPWAPLAASTLKGRKPGPILGDSASDLLWNLEAAGKWSVRTRQKPYLAYHLGPDRTRPARPFLPQTEAQGTSVSADVREALADWQRSHMGRA